jgi:Ca2+-binding RTX toxin-like protein
MSLIPPSITTGSLESWEYFASYGDLRGWALLDGVLNAADSTNAAWHYNTYASAEHRSIVFDAWEYLASNVDLINWLGADGITDADAITAAKHYITNGAAEGRSMGTFDSAAYLAANADLIAWLGATNYDAAAKHYIQFGRAEIAAGVPGRLLRLDNSFTLTTDDDTATANVFNSTPKLVPGTGYLTTLSDNDVLTGIGTNPTLNVEIGTQTDFTSEEAMIQPTLNGITTVNVAWTSDDVTELILADADALQTLNVTRITASNAFVKHTELSATVSTITLNDATRYGTVDFTTREEVLTGTSDVLAFGVNNVRVHAVTLNEGGDNDADLGFYYETINMTSNATNDIDALTIGANTREDLQNGLTEGTTTQTLSITAGASVGAAGSLEINQLTANGLETINIVANHRVDIVKDKLLPLSPSNDGISTSDLETVNISGAANVMIDGLDTTKQDAGVVLTVNAGTMTGNLKLGVQTPSDGNSSALYAFRADEDLKVTSGSGNDQIHTYGVLAGDISTGSGNDVVAIRGSEMGSADVEGVSQIDTGTGNDSVTAASLLVTAHDRDESNNTGFDDVTAASIVTGDGNDSVTVASLQSGSDWDNITLTDGNKNDQQKIIGATVSTGTGTDTVVFTSVAEGASVDTGADNDTVSVGLTTIDTILARDTDPDVQTLVDATHGESGHAYTDEVSSLGVIDRLGAIVDLGAGANDVISFTETDLGITDSFCEAPVETTREAFTIVDRDAEVRGAETMNVTALDAVNVDFLTTMADQDTTMAGSQTDINVNIIGTQILNLTIANQIEDTNTTDTVVQHTNGFHAVNDNNALDGAITTDVMRFDAALATINLASQERWLETGPATESFEAGTKTTFTLNNMREGVALTLSAFEATGVTPVFNGALVDDRVLAISTTDQDTVTGGVQVTGAITTNAPATDVRLNINYDGARDLNDAAALTINAAEAFDLSLNVDTVVATDTVGNAASTTDDDTTLVENFTLTFSDVNAHSVDMNGFGDANFRGTRAPLVAGDVSSTAVTSFTLNTGAAAGAGIEVDNVNADTIRVNNAAGTAVTAANVTLRVDADNNYNIATGSGTDIIDMRLDDVRSDDTASVLNRADTVSAGDGRDTLIVDGNDDLGTNDNAGSSPSMIVNDDVFMYLDSIETILVDTATANNGGNGDLKITIDEQAGTGAGNTNVDTIRMIGNLDNQMDLLIGNNFTVGSTVNTQNIAGGALLIDLNAHLAQTTLNIESKDDDTDIQFVNMDIQVAAKGGTIMNMVNSGSQTATVEVRVYTADENDAHVISSSNTGTGDGNVDINTGYVGSAATLAAGAFDKLVLVEGATSNDNSGAEGAMTIAIADRWTGGTFTVDASSVLDTDATLSTGGAAISVEYGDTATLLIHGTQNSDTIIGGRSTDTINGWAGNDIIVGDEVTSQPELEVVTFAATYDAGDVITVTHNGQSITATIILDGVTGAAVANAIALYDGAGLDGLADNITTAGTQFGSAAAVAAADKLRLTGVAPGTDYTVTATTNNANDNTAQVQTLTASNNTNGNSTANLTVTWNGTDYPVAVTDPAGGGDDQDNVTAPALINAVNAYATVHGLTGVSAIITLGVLTITGPSNGASFPLMTNVTNSTVTGTLNLVTGGDFGTDQPDPSVVTETVARSVIGAADTINGGTGNDDISGLIGADVLDGGEGIDTVNYSLSLAAVTVNLATNVVSGGDAQGDTISNFENVTGSNYHDVLTGSDAANTLDGGAGHDTIFGGLGADVILAGEGQDVVDGGAGIDTINLTESGVAPSVQVKDTVSSDVIALANADLITGFVSGTDKFDYNGALLNGLGTNADGIAGTDVITAATFAAGLVDPSSTAGVVFIAQSGVGSAVFTNVLASTASNLTTNYDALEAQLLGAGGALNGVIANLDSVLTPADSVLLVLDNDSTGSVVLRITNTDATGNTLTAGEVELVGVFVNTPALAAADFI